MSYKNFFGDVAGNNYSPQDQMNSIILACADGATIRGAEDFHAVEHLRTIAKGVQSYINGDVPGSEINHDERLRQMTVLELSAINSAIENPCTLFQTRALSDILRHGSLSSARLNCAKSQNVVENHGLPVKPQPVMEFISMDRG